jgi:hypothetical protein
MRQIQLPRFMIHLLLICAFLGNLFPGRVSAQASMSMHAYLTPANLASVRPQLPNDPVAAIQALVETIFGADEFDAQAAVGELMRRAGLPLVSIAGPVIGTPDELVLMDASIYVELLPDLTRSLRRGAFYTPVQLADLLLEIGFTSEALDPQVLVAALGQWGKQPDSILESIVAGATVRALSGRRLQVLYSGANPDLIQFDLLQVMLVLAHATSREAPLVKPSSWFTPQAVALIGSIGSQGIALPGWTAQTRGPCDDLAKLTQPATQLGGVGKEVAKEALVETFKTQLSEGAKENLDFGLKVYEKGSAVLSSLLLMMGATISVTDNKGGQTHFGHGGGGTNHVILKARASFDSAIAKQHVACYQLAGIDVPQSGPLEGYRVRWNFSQSLGGGYQGKFLTNISADSYKICASGSCGEVTGTSGTSTIEMYPPTERRPNQGTLMYGYVTATASLVKDDFPFALSDLLDLRNPAEFAASKTWDLAISAFQKAGLPSETHTIKVGYHGVDIYVAKGETNLWLLYVTAPVKLDIYTCTGLTGDWIGTGGLGGDTKAFLGEKVEQVFGIPVPENVKYIQENFHFMINPEVEENIIDINPEIKMTGIVRISQAQIAANRAIQLGKTVGRPVGEVEVEINSVPVSLLSFGAGTVYPVYSVPRDPRCPSSGEYYENYP